MHCILIEYSSNTHIMPIAYSSHTLRILTAYLSHTKVRRVFQLVNNEPVLLVEPMHEKGIDSLVTSSFTATAVLLSRSQPPVSATLSPLRIFYVILGTTFVVFFSVLLIACFKGKNRVNCTIVLTIREIASCCKA